MFRMFSAAGLAAAASLCAFPTAAAAQAAPATGPANGAPAIHASALSPIAPADLDIQNLSTNVTPAATNVQPVTVQPVTAHVRADAALTPGRARPDRIIEEPAHVRPAVATTPSLAGGSVRTGGSLDELVAQHAASEIGDEQAECLASAVYFESRGEPLEGQLAVAEVILNRVASGRFRSTICDVVTQPSQFSFVRGGRIPEPRRDTAAWHRAVAIAQIALNELHEVTGDASLFFHATYVRPAWGRASARIARIGRHIFYR